MEEQEGRGGQDIKIFKKKISPHSAYVFCFTDPLDLGHPPDAKSTLGTSSTRRVQTFLLTTEKSSSKWKSFQAMRDVGRKG